jgi:PAS domain S-box-containing protein
VSRRTHSDDRDWVLQRAREARRQKRDFAAVYRIVLPDGSIRYLEVAARHKFSADGEPVETVGTHVDVTERIRAQEERESDRTFLHFLSVLLLQAFAHEVDMISQHV